MSDIYIPLDLSKRSSILSTPGLDLLFFLFIYSIVISNKRTDELDRFCILCNGEHTLYQAGRGKQKFLRLLLC